ncbi:MAG: ACT domain-containing protein [Myxococcota bacterium]
MAEARQIVLELIVTNHPGVMSHVIGLFTRRAYNLERIVCGPIGDGEHSRVILLVDETERLAQVRRDLEGLYDVEQIRRRSDWEGDAFARIDQIAAGEAGGHLIDRDCGVRDTASGE